MDLGKFNVIKFLEELDVEVLKGYTVERNSDTIYDSLELTFFVSNELTIGEDREFDVQEWVRDWLDSKHFVWD